MRHPVLSKENLTVMFLTVPNDFAGWRKFANIDLGDEFANMKIHIPHRFHVNMKPALQGLRDNDSNYEDSAEDDQGSNPGSKNSQAINNITQIWSESPTQHTELDFVDNFNKLDGNLTRMAEIWSRLLFLVDRIEKREFAAALDHERASNMLDKFVETDVNVFGEDNMASHKAGNLSEEFQNLNIINTIFKQVSKFMLSTKKVKFDELSAVGIEVIENFKKFQDYLASLHFLMQRISIYRNESEKQVHSLLSGVTHNYDRLSQIKGKSDIKGSEVDRLVNVATKNSQQLETVISQIIFVKMTFLNEYALFQKVKYIASEAMQCWFRERADYGDKQQDALRRAFNDLEDLPLR